MMMAMYVLTVAKGNEQASNGDREDRQSAHTKVWLEANFQVVVNPPGREKEP